MGQQLLSGLTSDMAMIVLLTVFRHCLSHCTKQKRSVKTMAMEGIASSLRPRLTPQAQTELSAIQDLLSSLRLMETPDCRNSHLMDNEGRLQTSTLYALLRSAPETQADGQKLAWKNHAPPRVKFSAWAPDGEEDTVPKQSAEMHDSEQFDLRGLWRGRGKHQPHYI